MKRLIPLLFSFVLVSVVSTGVFAQDVNYSYLLSFEQIPVSKPPEISSVPFELPAEARRKGVEGTAKVSFVLGANGMIRDVQIVNDLPHGVGDAIRSAVMKTKFKPAEFQGKPIDIKTAIEVKLAMVFYESDKNVNKVKFASKPTAPYPDKFRSEGRKGKVNVRAIFYADGKVKVLNVDSTMPPEFDEIAKNAAEKLTFQPATHKSTKNPVSMQMWVTFEFKP